MLVALPSRRRRRHKPQAAYRSGPGALGERTRENSYVKSGKTLYIADLPLFCEQVAMSTVGKPVIQSPNAPVPPASSADGTLAMTMQLAANAQRIGLDARPELAALMARVAQGQDREAFRQLFVSIGPSLKGMLVRQGADRGTAEELVQETFLTVWRKAEQFSAERGSATTWIFTIARNLRIDRLRREVPWQELGEEQNEQASDDPLPDEQLSSQQIQTRMKAVLATLPADQTEVVQLAYLEGLSHGEIADRLKVPLGTVKSRMRLAYQKIKSSFQDAS